MNLVLQVSDEGRLADSHVRKVDFGITLIIMTSNIAGSLIARLHLNQDTDSVRTQVMKLVVSTAERRLLVMVEALPVTPNAPPFT